MMAFCPAVPRTILDEACALYLLLIAGRHDTGQSIGVASGVAKDMLGVTEFRHHAHIRGGNHWLPHRQSLQQAHGAAFDCRRNQHIVEPLVEIAKAVFRNPPLASDNLDKW